MCGIAGILMRHGPADEAALRRMAAALAHRGPDDVGIHLAGSLGLTNTRLSIIDVRGGHQPMVDERLALVANGEIYNFVELRPALEARGRRFQTGSDSEIILHAYALDGLPALASLHGMFAFALYDLATRELVLARDRLGIKPLYYAELPDRLLFASELKALLAVWPREPELEPQALVEFLQHRFNTGETGLVHGIRRLAPGTALVVDTTLHLREHRYWSPLELRPRRIRLEEAVEEFEPLIRRVMIEHLRADVPYGLFLSSGVDSGSLLALITELSGRPVRTFSIGYGDVRASDELGPAAGVARRFGAKHTEVILDRKAVFRRLPYTMWSTDDLLHDYASLPTSFLAERAAEELKVVLTGEGGDEVFAGYGRYRRHPLQRWMQRLVAGRVPFVDHRIVEFGLSLPDSLKVAGRTGKVVLRRWAERRLYPEHVWRRKRGFFVPIRQWLHGEMLDQLARLLPENAGIRRWFKPAGVAALVREQQQGGNASRALWGLMQIAIWHRIFVDRQTPGRDEDPLEWIA